MPSSKKIEIAKVKIMSKGLIKELGRKSIEHFRVDHKITGHFIIDYQHVKFQLRTKLRTRQITYFT
jgi:hypothetical protein